MKNLTRILLALAATLALALGMLSPATAATHKPQTWDCDTTGRTQCTGSYKGIGDAWESFDAVDIRYTYSNPYRYTGTYHKRPQVSPRSVVIRSVNLPHTWHVFTRKR